MNKITTIFKLSILSILMLSIALMYISNQADTISIDAQVTNTAPTVDSVFISDTANGLVDDYSGIIKQVSWALMSY